jgi:UPF0755 protein
MNNIKTYAENVQIMMKEYRFIIIVALIGAMGIPAYFFLDLHFYLNKPINPFEFKRTIISVSPGEKLNSITEDLYNQHLINFPIKFKIAARIQGFDRKIIAGEYAFSASMAPLKILESLEHGIIFLHRLTIPEGYTLQQIADKVDEAGFCSKADFLAVATDPQFAAEMQIPADTCEGYLFPDTYFFSKDTPPKLMIASMIKHFHKKFGPAWEARAQQLGMTIHEIVTLASIIEKEAGQDIERPIISSVFHNRLKKSMRLESDPTVIYGMKDFNGDITKKDLTEHTPYNTYVISGLPPGPIANPGIKSLKAALFPEDTNYLFFVSRKDGTHEFSSNLTDHNLAIQKYQLSAVPVPNGP